MNQNVKTRPPAVTAVTAVDALITSIAQNNILDESENKWKENVISVPIVVMPVRGNGTWKFILKEIMQEKEALPDLSFHHH